MRTDAFLAKHWGFSNFFFFFFRAVLTHFLLNPPLVYSEELWGESRQLQRAAEETGDSAAGERCTQHPHISAAATYLCSETGEHSVSVFGFCEEFYFILSKNMK